MVLEAEQPNELERGAGERNRIFKSLLWIPPFDQEPALFHESTRGQAHRLFNRRLHHDRLLPMALSRVHDLKWRRRWGSPTCQAGFLDP